MGVRQVTPFGRVWEAWQASRVWEAWQASGPWEACRPHGSRRPARPLVVWEARQAPSGMGGLPASSGIGGLQASRQAGRPALTSKPLRQAGKRPKAAAGTIRSCRRGRQEAKSRGLAASWPPSAEYYRIAYLLLSKLSRLLRTTS